jgi:hypothetical protein
MPEPLRRLFVGQRRGRIKKELGIDVGDALAYDFADTIGCNATIVSDYNPCWRLL